ncbi:hypothetical protein DPSP01_007929 [Paraphaeosphaeria sporulosa]
MRKRLIKRAASGRLVNRVPRRTAWALLQKYKDGPWKLRKDKRCGELGQRAGVLNVGSTVLAHALNADSEGMTSALVDGGVHNLLKLARGRGRDLHDRSRQGWQAVDKAQDE